MTFGYRSSFWAKEDNKKMLRHVIAMAGVPLHLCFACMHLQFIQSKLTRMRLFLPILSKLRQLLITKTTPRNLPTQMAS